MARPYLRTSQPIPPPSVRPAIPTRPGVAERRREPVGRGRVRVLAGGQAGLGPGEAPIGSMWSALHRAEVEDDAAVVRAVAGQAVAAAADRELERPSRARTGPSGRRRPRRPRGRSAGRAIAWRGGRGGPPRTPASREGRPSRAIRRRRPRGPMRRQGRGAGGGRLPSLLAPLGCIAGRGVTAIVGSRGRLGHRTRDGSVAWTSVGSDGRPGTRWPVPITALVAPMLAPVGTTRGRRYRGFSEIASGDEASGERSRPPGTSSAPVCASMRPLSSSSMSVAWVYTSPAMGRSRRAVL